jgi:hypothetical protein
MAKGDVVTLTVISETNITGRFRVAGGTMECECVVARCTPDGELIETWPAWRPATEADHELAFLRRA